MTDELKVTPAEETQEIQPEEVTEQEVETETETKEVETVETTEVQSEEDKIAQLENEIMQLKNLVQARDDDEEVEETQIDIPKDVKELLTKFAENPHETLKNFVENETREYKRLILDLQKQNAIDYIRSQKDFTDKMYDEVLYVVNTERNRLFNIGNTTYKLKDLPPRQKAEAALQILRERKKGTNIKRPKPPSTIKAKPTTKTGDKDDALLSAEEFAAKHGIKVGAL